MRKSEYAEARNLSKGRISQLIKEGRVQLTLDGLVDVEMTDALLAATNSDPRGGDRTGKHKARQEEAIEQATGSTVVELQSIDAMKLRERRAKATLAEIEVKQRLGELMDVDQARYAAIEAGTRLRTMLERLPDRLAEELVTIDDPKRIHAILVERIEETLNEIADAFEAWGRT